ncbi:AAA family ATPase [Nocardia sp. GCM10030253]|uniref:AAA family ATPase n=1 Tax=Nocardia sp. GCM10030253 TaxID=3273404 RepID=UPI003629405F
MAEDLDHHLMGVVTGRSILDDDERAAMTVVCVGKLVVLVNGLPGAGKSTLAPDIARELGAHVLSKDVVKEALAGCMGDPRDVATLGGIAMDAVWAMAAAIPRSVVIDSWWFRPRDAGFARTGIQQSGAERAVEIWCDPPIEVARARYAQRRRAAVHDDENRLTRDWETWAEHGRPLDLAPVIRVDTSRSVDSAGLAEQIETMAGPLHPIHAPDR